MEPKRRQKGTGSIFYRPSRDRWEGTLRVGGQRRSVFGHDRVTVEQRLDDLARDPDAQRVTLSERVADLEQELQEARAALTHYLESRRAPISQAQRYRIISRDGERCRYCGVAVALVDIVLDHVIPWARGGRNDDDNLVVACPQCNHVKGKKLPPSVWLKYRKPMELPIIWV